MNNMTKTICGQEISGDKLEKFYSLPAGLQECIEAGNKIDFNVFVLN